MKKQAIATTVTMLALGALSGCGGGGNGSGGGHLAPFAGMLAPAPASDSASPPVAAPAPGPGPAASPAVATTTTFIKRALDTVSPIAANGDLDIRLSADLAAAFSVTYTLEKPDGSNPVSVALRGGSAGLFFPKTPALVKLLMPAQTAPGSYVLRAKGQAFDSVTSALVTIEATLPIELNTLSLNMTSLSYSNGLIIGGSSRLMPLTYTSAVDGTLFVYALGQSSAVCAAKTATELAAIPNVQTRAVTGSINCSPGTFGPATQFADADTACLQFVRASDSVAEAPYTFNFRYEALPTSGDLLLALGADPAAVPKESVGLMSLPWSGNTSNGGFFDWLQRRQVFTAGDVREQTTGNSSRISFEQAGGTWQYRLSAPVATDHPFYVAKIEGRPPMVFFVKP